MRRVTVLVLLVLLLGVGPIPTAAATYTRTYASGTVNLAFGSMQASINSVITVPSHGTITDVNVSVVINHTFLSDIGLMVVHEAGTSVVLLQNNCGNLDNVNATFDDEGAALTCNLEPPAISDSVAPENTATYHHLSGFDGEDMAGAWTLVATDNYPDWDDGLLVEWSLTFELSGDEPPPAAFGKVSPPNDQIQEPLQPTLTWQVSDGASYYEYCIEADDGNDDCGSGWVNVGAGTSATPSLQDGVNYIWQVRAVNAAGTTYADVDWWWGFWTYVSNDEAETAWAIDALPYTRSQPLQEATEGDDDPTFSCTYPPMEGYQSVWYTYTAGSSFPLQLDTIGSNFDSILAVYTGSPGSLTEVACNDDLAWHNYQSQLQVPVVENTTYLIQVASLTSNPAALLTLNATAGTYEEMSFRSAAAYDGWVLESEGDSGKGLTTDAAGATFFLGDDGADRQYRAILSFDTSALPDDAIVYGVTIRVKREGITGMNPFTTHGYLQVDMKTGAFHEIPALEKYDFQAMGSRGNVGRFIKTPSSGWYRAPLRTVAYPLVNLYGTTQFRLRFFLDDNADMGADYLRFYSGNAVTEADRPELIVVYSVP